MSGAIATRPPEPVEHTVGTRVRALRDAMGLSLRDLSDRTGVSAPMLSQVERGETSPTLAVAERIAAGLELSLSQLLRLDEGGHLVITRRGKGRRRRRAGHRVEELTPAIPGQRADVSLHVLDSDAVTGGEGDPPLHEPGSRETVYVQSGAVVLTIDGAEHHLGEGDSVTFDADLPHHFANRDDEAAEFIAVVAAGLRRS
jgi:XRE family transcriptional regulator, regulator of sulfur utilization